MRPPNALRDDEQERRAARRVERECRTAFLTAPDHDDVCICDLPCSRDYNPMPYPEAEPFPMRNYTGTGIGALYGGPMTADMAISLAGWNLPRPTRRKDQLEGWDIQPGSRR